MNFLGPVNGFSKRYQIRNGDVKDKLDIFSLIDKNDVY